jgi:hypothetical protein
MDPKEVHQLIEGVNVFSIQDFGGIKKRPDILENLRFDVTPGIIMEPCLDPEKRKSLSGFMFYIEAYDDPPLLMLMKVGKTGITSTVGKVEEIPAEMVRRAVDNPVEPECNRMYAITEEIREWLQKELAG